MSSPEKQELRAKNLVHTWFHRYRRGSLRFFILHLLLNKHSNTKSKRESFHGYKLAKAIKTETRDEWSPTTASIYPILKELAKEGIIEQTESNDSSSESSKRSSIQYCLTPFGLTVAKHLEEHRKNMARHFISRTGDSHHPPPPIFHLPKDELLAVLKKSDKAHLEDFQKHLLSLQKHNQSLLEMIEKLLQEKQN